jgi:hypothetical protein
MLLTGFGSTVGQALSRTTGLTIIQDSGTRSGDSTQKAVDATVPQHFASDSLKKINDPGNASSIVVPGEWQVWVHKYQYTPKDSTQKEGFVREGSAGTATISFLLLTFGLLLIAADRQRYVHMSRAFLHPRLFEQFLRQQSNSHGSGWAIARFVYFLILMATCIALYRYRMQLTAVPLTLDGLYIFGITFLVLSFFFLMLLLAGLIFDQIEWTINHVQTTWVYFQLTVPVLLFAILLAATLPTSQFIASLLTIAVLLILGWIYRLVLGWIRSFHTSTVGVGYIIFYFCTFELLPLVLLLKYVTIHQY